MTGTNVRRIGGAVFLVCSLTLLPGGIPEAQALKPFASSASPDADLCQVEESSILSRTRVGSEPNYFFRIFPFSRRVSFATNEGNQLLDLDTGKIHKLIGRYDPVPLGERLMSVPDTLVFYLVDELLAHTNLEGEGGKPGDFAQPRFKTDLGGVYQSVGVVSGDVYSKGNGPFVYRVITDKNSLSAIDVKVDFSGKEPAFEMVKAADDPCPSADFKLPMLSKDGTEIAGFDMKTGTTKIWKINRDLGTCDEVEDLGFSTGKADFSYDGRKLTFHLASDGEEGVQYFSRSQPTAARNVYVYDRDTHQIRKLTHNTFGNSYYPVWRADGTVVYIDVNTESQSSFVVADPKQAFAVDFRNLNCPNCKGQEAKEAQVAAGRIWFAVCAKVGEANPPVAALTTLSLDPESCRKMVDRYWDSLRKSVDPSGGLTLERVRAACPTEKRSVSPAKVKVVGNYGLEAREGPKTGWEVAQRKCAMCHTNIEFQNTHRISNELREKMVRLIRSGEMPKGRSLGSEEKELLIDYLKPASQ